MEIDKHLHNTHGQGAEIHVFMDQYWAEFKEDHRVVFHHKKGVDFLINKFGEESRWIIEQHLRDDHYGTGFRGVPESPHDFNGYTDRFEEVKQFADKILGV